MCLATDIASVLDWARANDDLAAAIAHNARSWALMYLNNECVANYMKDVFDSYAKIMARDFVPGNSSFPYKEVKLNPRVALYLGRSCAGTRACVSMAWQHTSPILTVWGCMARCMPHLLIMLNLEHLEMTFWGGRRKVGQWMISMFKKLEDVSKQEILPQGPEGMLAASFVRIYKIAVLIPQEQRDEQYKPARDSMQVVALTVSSSSWLPSGPSNSNLDLAQQNAIPPLLAFGDGVVQVSEGLVGASTGHGRVAEFKIGEMRAHRYGGRCSGSWGYLRASRIT
eukprot:1161882-Pelagomonas_calceolata.AAC.1